MTTRRSALALLTAGVLPARLADAQHQMQEASKKNPGEYRLQFFTPEEHRLLDRLTEMILPAGERAPGASAARVADFIDLVVANSSPETQQSWRSGLHQFTDTDLTAALNESAREEQSPATPRGRFFVELKMMTIHAYYTSEIGLKQELGYRGPEVLTSFPGCRARRS